MLLIPEWQLILKKAWSIKWTAAAFTFTFLEIAIPVVQPLLPHGLFALISGLCSAMAFYTRLRAQKGITYD